MTDHRQNHELIQPWDLVTLRDGESQTSLNIRKFRVQGAFNRRYKDAFVALGVLARKTEVESDREIATTVYKSGAAALYDLGCEDPDVMIEAERDVDEPTFTISPRVGRKAIGARFRKHGFGGK